MTPPQRRDADEQLVLALQQPVQQRRTQPGTEEPAQQYVGVQEHPHENSRKKSSSLMNPSRSAKGLSSVRASSNSSALV